MGCGMWILAVMLHIPCLSLPLPGWQQPGAVEGQKSNSLWFPRMLDLPVFVPKSFPDAAAGAGFAPSSSPGSVFAPKSSPGAGFAPKSSPGAGFAPKASPGAAAGCLGRHRHHQTPFPDFPKRQDQTFPGEELLNASSPPGGEFPQGLICPRPRLASVPAVSPLSPQVPAQSRGCCSSCVHEEQVNPTFPGSSGHFQEDFAQQIPPIPVPPEQEVSPGCPPSPRGGDSCAVTCWSSDTTAAALKGGLGRGEIPASTCAPPASAFLLLLLPGLAVLGMVGWR